MPKKVINALNAGELSPYLYARSDLEKYDSGCLVMENFVPLPYGGATRRPAIEYIGDSKDDDKVRLIPFSTSSDISYLLEMGDQYVRFYTNGALVTDTFSAWSNDTEVEQKYGFLRTESGNYYRCVENHFTGEFQEALDAGNWGTIDDWDSSVSYVANDIIVHEGAFYICILASTNNEPPNATYWTVINETVFAVDTVYAQYDVVEYKDEFYQCLIGYTSAGFSEDLASGYWAQTASTDTAYEIPSVYVASDLMDIKFVQSIDVMWFVHPDNPVQRLSRVSESEWTLDAEVFDYPPLLDENDTDITMTPSAVTGDITITSSEDYFNSDMVGGTMEIIYGRSRSAPLASGNISQNGEFSDEYDVSGLNWSVEIEASGDRRGGYVQTNINGAGWITQYTYNGNNTGEYSEPTPEITTTLLRFGSDKIKGCAWSLFSGNTISINEDLGASGGVDTVDISSPLNVSSVNWTLETGGTLWRGLVEVERSENGVDGWEKYLTIGDTTETFNASFKNLSFSTDEPEGLNTWIRVKYTKGKSVEANDELVLNLFTTDPEYYGLAKITGYTSATEVSATVVSALGGTGATKRWSEAAFSDHRGHPSAVSLFENRLCYAGTASDPNTIWMSIIDDYSDFKLGDIDGNAIKITLNSGKIDEIRWIVPQERLVIGTSGSEWSLGASDERKAITPTGFDLKRKTTYGSNSVQAILVNSAVLFLMRQGRKVREWTPNYNLQDYVAPDLSILAEHITEGGITQWDYQQQPDNIIWMIRGDGTLLGFTYERDQNVVGWHRHLLGGVDAVSNKQVGTFDGVINGDSVGLTSEITLGDTFGITIRGYFDSTTPAFYRIFATQDSNGTNGNLNLWRSSSGDGVTFRLYPDGVSDQIVAITQSIFDDDWHDIRFEYDSGEYLVYVDGDVVKEGSIDHGVGNGFLLSDEFKIMGQSGANSFGATGSLCVFAVDGEFRYEFDDGGTSTTVTDKLGNNDGVINLGSGGASAFWANTRNLAAVVDGFESVAILPQSGGEDQVWVSCKIIIDGQNKRFIGRLNDREWGTNYLTEWQGSDYWVSYTDPGTDPTLSGLDHLEGRAVSVVADGVPLTDETVYNGSIDITGTYTTVVVGLPYTSTLAPLYLDADSQYGSSSGSKKAARKAVIRFKDTYSAKAGRNTSDLESVKFDPDSSALYDGDFKTWFDSSSDYLLSCYVVQDQQMPCTVLAMIPEVEVR